ncbi:MAG: orotidine-5'-phosphate decarboxylase [SAR86 cluster bacterium]|uniref:Orotidine 5'-phosphate decarboxylase n=1 Tax=SAR86 cluster bacterium TaxID=2030880 RepID=A0A2A5CDF1_9GAMM|nr:MAG: orotidine-5'-phosphate decarboxylase [SAR86 cluster bacterium]
MNYNKQIIVALDFPTEKACLDFLKNIDPARCRVKVGKELFTRCGPALVKKINAEGYDVFLDLKFHDIPNTVAGALKAAADLGVWMVNVHASGGKAMLDASREALNYQQAPLLIAVTVLTSMGIEDLSQIAVINTPQQQVQVLASLAVNSGLDGVVCSAQETDFLRLQCPSDFQLVTPGIRPSGDSANDQKRVVSPRLALEQGSNFLVIGRPITQASNPSEKLDSIIQEIEA